MKSLLRSILLLTHSTLIIYLTFALYQINKSLPADLVGLQIAFTIILQAFKITDVNRDWKQIFLSLSLVYALRPSQLGFLRYFYLGKIFYVYRCLAQIADSSLLNFWANCKLGRLTRVIYNLARASTVFYMFLGIVAVVYKYWAYLWMDPQKTLSTHEILYYLVITSSSVGYGDVTPKNDYQIYFMLTFIPLLIISFGIYFGQVVSCLEEAITLFQEAKISAPQTETLNIKNWSQNQGSSWAVEYIEKVKNYNAVINAERNLNGSNWMSWAIKSHQVCQPLLMQILDKNASKQYKMLVSSGIKKQFFPQNWTILQKGNIDQQIYMISQGEIEVQGKILRSGEVFNQAGFLHREPSQASYTTNSFVGVWALGARDLDHVSKLSVRGESKIRQQTR